MKEGGERKEVKGGRGGEGRGEEGKWVSTCMYCKH